VLIYYRADYTTGKMNNQRERTYIHSALRTSLLNEMYPDNGIHKNE